MVPAGKTLDILVAFIFWYKPLKVFSWKKVHKLGKNIATLVHWLLICCLLTKCKFPQSAVFLTIAQSYHDGDILATQVDTTEHLAGLLPMWWQRAVGLKFNSKDMTLSVLDLPDVHTLDADVYNTQIVGYAFSNSLATVVHDDDWIMFHIHKN